MSIAGGHVSRPPSSAILISYWVWQEVFVTSSNFDAL
jgi:hypothetical protein